MPVILVSVLVTGLFIAALVSFYYKLPNKDPVEAHSITTSYLIQSLNRMDFQEHYECAAFSSAYVLRHLGIEADGNKLYRAYPRKLYDGTVSPKGILLFFRKRGYDASFYYGDVKTLKKRVNQGNPVIVFIRVFPNQRYLHFAPVVGYDEEYLYLADSLNHTINCNERYYNRKISIHDFEALWKTWVPFCNNTYIVIRRQ